MVVILDQWHNTYTYVLTNLIYFITETPPPLLVIPLPSQVQGVMLTQSVTSLTVSWTAVTHQMYDILYVVRYSTDSGTEKDPPSDAMKRSGITDTSTTLSPTGLQSNTTYYVWIAAEIRGAGVQGPYSMRMPETTYSGNVRSYNRSIIVGINVFQNDRVMIMYLYNTYNFALGPIYYIFNVSKLKLVISFTYIS